MSNQTIPSIFVLAHHDYGYRTYKAIVLKALCLLMIFPIKFQTTEAICALLFRNEVNVDIYHVDPRPLQSITTTTLTLLFTRVCQEVKNALHLETTNTTLLYIIRRRMKHYRSHYFLVSSRNSCVNENKLFLTYGRPLIVN